MQQISATEKNIDQKLIRFAPSRSDDSNKQLTKRSEVLKSEYDRSFHALYSTGTSIERSEVTHQNVSLEIALGFPRRVTKTTTTTAAVHIAANLNRTGRVFVVVGCHFLATASSVFKARFLPERPASLVWYSAFVPHSASVECRGCEFLPAMQRPRTVVGLLP